MCNTSENFDYDYVIIGSGFGVVLPRKRRTPGLVWFSLVWFRFSGFGGLVGKMVDFFK